MKKVIRYFNIFKTITKLSFMTRLAYRLNGILLVVNMTFRLLTVVIFLQIVFSKTHAIGDWTKPQIFLFYGVFLLIDSIFDTLFGKSLQKISEYVEEGDLDLVLTKPANSIFLLSFREFYLFNFINILFSFLILSYALNNLNIAFNPLNVFFFFSLLCFGLVGYYSIYLILATISFYTIRTPFTELLETLSGIMRFPLDIFGKNWQFFFTFFIPMIFVVTVPTKMLLGISDSLYYIAPIITIILFITAIKFWNLSIKRYSSASS